MDRDLNYINVNKKYQLRLGLSLNRIVKQNYKDYHSLTETKKFRKKVEEVFKSGYPVTYDYKSERDGRYFLRTLSPVKDFETKKITSVIINSKDITESKRLEEQLQIRQRMDSLGTLAGGIAHDFNNLLQNILGNLELLKLNREDISADKKEFLSNAITGCDQAAKLTKKLHSLTKSIITEKTSVDVYNIAKSVFDLLKDTTDRLIDKKNDIKPGIFCVHTNKDELHQVILNLATNSIHAIEKRGVKSGDYIRINAEEYISEKYDIKNLSEGKYVHICFEDNGIGMSEEIKRKAFDPLFSTQPKGVETGQGLGLAMVYNIVTKSGNGHIEIESEEGKGTEIHIYLPYAEPKEKEEIEEAEIRGGNETIFVIDDEVNILKATKRQLSMYEYNVETFSDGEEALGEYKKNKDSIDLIILDIAMPKMSGKMVFERLRKIKKDVKVIVASGYSEEDIKKGIFSHAKAYLPKPFKVEKLAKTVRMVLDL